MPQSIYDNGGMIGATLDFGSTEQYIIGTTAGLQDIQYLGSTAKPNGTATSLALPSGLQQNDLVIYAFSGDTAVAANPTGWTNGQTGTTNSVNYRWGYKFMGATPDTTIAISSGESAAIAFAFRNVNTTTPLDVTPPTATTATSGMPNPPSITTSTDKSVIVALGFLDDDELNNTVVAQSGYTIINSASAQETTVMASYKVKTPAGADDPAVFTNTGTAGTDSWVGATLALRPATGSVPLYGNFKNSGIWSLSAVLDSIISASIISLVSSTTSSTNSITVPTVSAGDLAVLLNVAHIPNVTTPPAAVFPSGFTTVFNYSVNGSTTNDAQRSIASIKVLNGSESGSSLTLMNGTRNSAVLMIFRNSSGTISSATVQALSGGSTQSDPTAIVTDLTGYAKPLIFIASYGGDGITVTDATSTPAISEIAASTAGTNQLIAGYKIYNLTDGLESITIDQPDIDVNSMASFVLEIGLA